MRYTPKLRPNLTNADWPSAFRALYEDPWSAIAYEVTLHPGKPYAETITKMLALHGAGNYVKAATCMHAWVCMYQTLRLARYLQKLYPNDRAMFELIEDWFSELDEKMTDHWYENHYIFPRWLYEHTSKAAPRTILFFDIYASLLLAPLWFHVEIYRLLQQEKDVLGGDDTGRLQALTAFVNSCPFVGEVMRSGEPRIWYDFIPVNE